MWKYLLGKDLGMNTQCQSTMSGRVERVYTYLLINLCQNDEYGILFMATKEHTEWAWEKERREKNSINLF